MLYVIYNVKFAPPTIEANTMEGEISEETMTLSFTVAEMSNGDVYRVADSGTATTVAQNWYQKVYTGGEGRAAKEKPVSKEKSKNTENVA